MPFKYKGKETHANASGELESYDVWESEMPTRRIDAPKENQDPNSRRSVCQHPEHEPPSMRVFKPGTYEHTCPGCGHKGFFVVPEGPRL